MRQDVEDDVDENEVDEDSPEVSVWIALFFYFFLSFV